jgi:D-3-phosphoglycerate dehydrogenase
MKVLVTDYAWPSLDIERAILGAVGAELIVARSGEEAELVALAPEADAILTNWKRVTPAVLDAAPRCRIVSRYGVGIDNIAVDRATELGILVTNVPDFCIEEVSDHAMALLLACARSIVKYARATSSGRWDLQEGRPLPRLRGQTLGLIGFGNLARAMVPKALGFGLKVMAYTPRIAPDALAPYGVATRDLGLLLRESDYISLHVPLTPGTRGMIDENALRQMKPSAFLINTARGAVVDEAALLRALAEGWLAGAGLDVLIREPADLTQPLLSLPNVIVTPHAAFYSEPAIEELQHKAAERVVAALQGEIPPNVVNPAVLGQANRRSPGEPPDRSVGKTIESRP